jgi:hypothetical protein
MYIYINPSVVGIQLSLDSVHKRIFFLIYDFTQKLQRNIIFALFDTPTSGIKISFLIYCILKLTFSVKILLQLTLLFDIQLITVGNNFKILSLEQRIYLIQC